MKTIRYALSLILFASCLFPMFGCGQGLAEVSSQVDPVGGYENEREPTEEEIGLFQSVVKDTQYASYKPLEVSTQVVAGMNYRFYCSVSDTSDNSAYAYVTIYEPLGEEAPSITSVEEARSLGTGEPQADSITEVPMTIRTFDGTEFEGKLRMPGEQSVHRLVIYVNSSGPHTYDDRRLFGENEVLYHDFFAEALAGQGVAYFSYNTRGVAPSDNSPLFYEIDDAAYQGYKPSNQIRDVEQIILRLQEMEELKDAEIYLLGWSEGTMIAPQVALAGNVRVDRLLLAGYMHRTMADTLKWQQSGYSSMVNLGRYYDYDEDGIITEAEFEEDRYNLQGAFGQFPDLDVNGDKQLTTDDFAMMLAENQKALFAAFEGGDDAWLTENYPVPLTSAWYLDHATFAPNAEILPKLDIPIEVFHGRFDGSVPVEDVYALEESFRALGKDNLTVHVFQGGDHDLNYVDYICTGTVPEGLQSLLDACTETR